MKTKCDKYECEREGKPYFEYVTSYEETGVRTYRNKVIRCGYHHYNSNYSHCLPREVEN